MNFEWDDRKDLANQDKHGISFGEAISIFVDPEVVILDAAHEEDDEARSKAIGQIEGRLFVVVFTDRQTARRIISARRANRKEERAYAEREDEA